MLDALSQCAGSGVDACAQGPWSCLTSGCSGRANKQMKSVQELAGICPGLGAQALHGISQFSVCVVDFSACVTQFGEFVGGCFLSFYFLFAEYPSFLCSDQGTEPESHCLDSVGKQSRI